MDAVSNRHRDDEYSPDRLWLKFAARMADAVSGTGTIAIVSIPAPLCPPELLIAARPQESGFLWSSTGQFCATGSGVAHRIRTSGEHRIADAVRQAKSLWDSTVSVAPPACEPPQPRLFGGLSFAPGGLSDSTWSDFADLEFILPEWTYIHEGDQAWLQCALVGHALRSTGERRRKLAEVEDTLSLLSRGNPGPVTRARAGRNSPHVFFSGKRSEWEQQVRRAQLDIRGGEIDKVVLSRRTVVELGGLDPMDILEALRVEEPNSTRFSFRFGNSTFLGRTPERLVRKQGRRFETEAVAGTAPLSDENGRALLSDTKERLEHDFVVNHIVKELSGMTRNIVCPAQPGLRQLRYLQHLVTPIHGTLAAPDHVLRLVERLHPTPAVAGTPREAAMRWVLDHEGYDRGWYSGPVGWFDREGDGEFNVALRSALFVGDRCHVFAGAGIVASSVARQEYEETRQKMSLALSALGLVL